MSNKSYRVQMDEDRAHELCVFLGGDAVALRTSNALRRFGYVQSVEQLRDEYARGERPGYYLEDCPNIGPQAMQRIKEKIEGPAVPLMDVRTASLIIRMELALTDEGIGARDLRHVTSLVSGEVEDTSEDDRAVLDQAVRVAGHLFLDSVLMDVGLL
jgi:hypothetical protein